MPDGILDVTGILLQGEDRPAAREHKVSVATEPLVLLLWHAHDDEQALPQSAFVTPVGLDRGWLT
jgi:hypothetical protein